MTVRVEECVCGGPPIASSTLKDAGIHVAVHNATPAHVAWRRVRAAQEAYADELRYLSEIESERTTFRVPQSRPTAARLGASGTDIASGGDGLARTSTGASAGAEGAA